MSTISPIETVVIYRGHLMNGSEKSYEGPYAANVTKQERMFNLLNRYRMEEGKLSWKVVVVSGQDLVSTISELNTKTTLLVLPAGQSSTLDKVFTVEQNTFIKETFCKTGGGRIYATCGAAYYLSETRIYDGLCTLNPTTRETVTKTSRIALFSGVAQGPLCPFPGEEYQVGFYSDAVTVTDGIDNCTIFLSGGGSFIPKKGEENTRVLVRYTREELDRLKPGGRFSGLENAVVLTNYGKGTILLSMFHPYYGEADFDVTTYEKVFPKKSSGTNWQAVHDRISPEDVRMRFIMRAMLNPLENITSE